MTTFELNAEIYQNLSYIANDEGKLKKALAAIKKIIKSDRKENIHFPKIGPDFHISQTVANGSIGPLPQDVDFEKETDKMWEELAK